MTYSEMKDSGIPYIGEIPSHWRITKTLHCLSMPITDGPHTTPELYDSGVPFISAEAVSCGNGKIDFSHMRGYISEDFYEECCKKYVPQIDDIYMIKSGATTGRVAIVDTDRIFTIWSPLAAFRANRKRVFPKFLFYALQSDSYQKQVELGWTYGTQQNIGMRTLETLKVCLPPLDEQVTIVAYLDRQFSVIDSIIDEAKASIEEYKHWKVSAICQAVTKGLDPNAEIQDCEIEWIGESPTTWQILRVKYLLTEINVRSESGNEPPLSMSQVYGLVPSEMISVANPATSFVGAKIVNPDDLVFNKLKAHLGVFAVSDYYGLVSPDYAVYRANNRVLPKFLEYLFKTPRCITEFKKYISGVGAGLSRLYTSDLFNIHIALPPMREQIQIVSYLDKLCSEIGGVISEKESLISELEAYKKSLIYEAVTGKRKVG